MKLARLVGRGEALFAVRALVAVIFLWHGVPKVLDPGAAVQKFHDFGLPGLLGPLTGIVEVFAAMMLLLGVMHTFVSGILGVIIVGALLTVQIPNGVTAALERDLLILVGILTLLAHGPGAWTVAVQRPPGRTI